MRTKVVVTGMGVVSPLGNDVDTFWAKLCAGTSGIRAVSFDTENIPSKIAGQAEDVEPEGMAPKEIRRQGRFILFAVEASDQAMRQAGLETSREDPARCGAVIATGIGGIEDIYENVVKMENVSPKRLSPFFLPRGLANMASGQVAIRHGLQGPNRCTVTACAGGTQAIGEATDLIRLGKADVMLAGGAEAAVIPFGLAGFAAMRALSTKYNDQPEKASRPFDKDRDGFVMGEGAGVLVLESEDHAKKRGATILAEVAGVGESCDAHHVTAPLSDGAGPANAIRRALEEAQIDPARVDYCNAHGTSTPLNDPSECKALQSVFGDHRLFVSSTKSMIGHLLGAAGAVEAVASLMTILSGVIHPSINYDTPDPDCDLNLVANEARQQKVAIALSNSLGFGGHNASVLFKNYE